MNRIFISLVIGFAVVGSLAVFQMTKATAATVFTPSELAPTLSVNRERIRVAGRVTDLPIRYELEPKVRLEFSIEDPPAKLDANHQPVAKASAAPKSGVAIPVSYDGVKPDMFTVGRDVIIDGNLVDGKLVAVKLLTQCPSKYEAPDPSKQYGLK